MTDLLTNWGEISRKIGLKMPYISAAVIDRDILVEGENITLFYNRKEIMIKTIAKLYQSDIQNALKDITGKTYHIRIAEKDGVAND